MTGYRGMTWTLPGHWRTTGGRLYPRIRIGVAEVADGVSHDGSRTATNHDHYDKGLALLSDGRSEVSQAS